MVRLPFGLPCRMREHKRIQRKCEVGEFFVFCILIPHILYDLCSHLNFAIVRYRYYYIHILLFVFILDVCYVKIGKCWNDWKNYIEQTLIDKLISIESQSRNRKGLVYENYEEYLLFIFRKIMFDYLAVA